MYIITLKNTKDTDWCIDVVRNKEGQNCLFGHIHKMGSKGVYIDGKFLSGDSGGGRLWDWFECAISSTYQIYLINDGKNPKYQQKTAKERCIAFIENVYSGKEQNTMESMEECASRT